MMRFTVLAVLTIVQASVTSDPKPSDALTQKPFDTLTQTSCNTLTKKCHCLTARLEGDLESSSADDILDLSSEEDSLGHEWVDIKSHQSTRVEKACVECLAEHQNDPSEEDSSIIVPSEEDDNADDDDWVMPVHVERGQVADMLRTHVSEALGVIREPSYYCYIAERISTLLPEMHPFRQLYARAISQARRNVFAAHGLAMSGLSVLRDTQSGAQDESQWGALVGACMGKEAELYADREGSSPNDRLKTWKRLCNERFNAYRCIDYAA